MFWGSWKNWNQLREKTWNFQRDWTRRKQLETSSWHMKKRKKLKKKVIWMNCKVTRWSLIKSWRKKTYWKILSFWISSVHWILETQSLLSIYFEKIKKLWDRRDCSNFWLHIDKPLTKYTIDDNHKITTHFD